MTPGTGIARKAPPGATGDPGLVTTGRANWPEPGDPPEPPGIAGFVVSTFAPLVVAVAQRCLTRAPAPPSATAIVIVTGCGDVASARHVAGAVDAGTRIGPLMFFQSVPNAVAGHLAARYGLDGPVVCLSPAEPAAALADGLAEAALLIADGDAGGALVIVAEQDPDHAYAVFAQPRGEVR